MIFTTFYKTYNEITLDKNNILRYMKAKDNAPEIQSLLDECITLSKDKLKGKVCYSVFDISFCGDTLDLGFTKTDSKALKTHLENCNKIVLFASTVGIDIDMLVTKYSPLSPSKAFCIGAIGTEAVENICDRFCDDIATEYGECAARFSPGYADLPLDMQKEIFSVLDTKKIGLSLSDSLLMTPKKSVTAIIGIKNN